MIDSKLNRLFGNNPIKISIHNLTMIITILISICLDNILVNSYAFPYHNIFPPPSSSSLLYQSSSPPQTSSFPLSFFPSPSQPHQFFSYRLPSMSVEQHRYFDSQSDNKLFPEQSPTLFTDSNGNELNLIARSNSNPFLHSPSMIVEKFATRQLSTDEPLDDFSQSFPIQSPPSAPLLLPFKSEWLYPTTNLLLSNRLSSASSQQQHQSYSTHQLPQTLPSSSQSFQAPFPASYPSILEPNQDIDQIQMESIGEPFNFLQDRSATSNNDLSSSLRSQWLQPPLFGLKFPMIPIIDPIKQSQSRASPSMNMIDDFNNSFRSLFANKDDEWQQNQTIPSISIIDLSNNNDSTKANVNGDDNGDDVLYVVQMDAKNPKNRIKTIKLNSKSASSSSSKNNRQSSSSPPSLTSSSLQSPWNGLIAGLRKKDFQKKSESNPQQSKQLNFKMRSKINDGYDLDAANNNNNERMVLPSSSFSSTPLSSPSLSLPKISTRIIDKEEAQSIMGRNRSKLKRSRLNGDRLPSPRLKSNGFNNLNDIILNSNDIDDNNKKNNNSDVTKAIRKLLNFSKLRSSFSSSCDLYSSFGQSRCLNNDFGDADDRFNGENLNLINGFNVVDFLERNSSNITTTSDENNNNNNYYYTYNGYSDKGLAVNNRDNNNPRTIDDNGKFILNSIRFDNKTFPSYHYYTDDQNVLSGGDGDGRNNFNPDGNFGLRIASKDNTRSQENLNQNDPFVANALDSINPNRSLKFNKTTSADRIVDNRRTMKKMIGNNNFNDYNSFDRNRSPPQQRSLEKERSLSRHSIRNENNFDDHYYLSSSARSSSTSSLKFDNNYQDDGEKWNRTARKLSERKKPSSSTMITSRIVKKSSNPMRLINVSAKINVDDDKIVKGGRHRSNLGDQMTRPGKVFDEKLDSITARKVDGRKDTKEEVERNLKRQKKLKQLGNLLSMMTVPKQTTAEVKDHRSINKMDMEKLLTTMTLLTLKESTPKFSMKTSTNQSMIWDQSKQISRWSSIDSLESNYSSKISDLCEKNPNSFVADYENECKSYFYCGQSSPSSSLLIEGHHSLTVDNRSMIIQKFDCPSGARFSEGRFFYDLKPRFIIIFLLSYLSTERSSCVWYENVRCSEHKSGNSDPPLLSSTTTTRPSSVATTSFSSSPPPFIPSKAAINLKLEQSSSIEPSQSSTTPIDPNARNHRIE